MQAINVFKNMLMPPLTNLYSSLSIADEDVRHTEALVGALAEELDEVVVDAREGKDNKKSVIKSATTEVNLGTKLTDLLKRLKGKIL